MRVSTTLDTILLPGKKNRLSQFNKENLLSHIAKTREVRRPQGSLIQWLNDVFKNPDFFLIFWPALLRSLALGLPLLMRVKWSWLWMWGHRVENVGDSSCVNFLFSWRKFPQNPSFRVLKIWISKNNNIMITKICLYLYARSRYHNLSCISYW